ncbi:hypothetical protein [Microseira wollei]|uniref:Uncharacterized protein n=1 Tax=Microseira wollei NIES-4236 TaxID=2530354 RepID=A0AAV3XIL0_9CYAN|nr:hypothetical protein [Microseira wollei]GET41326.1 hypothetical protein MiSe_61380 [Microseira wollei NIES-4236]
MRRNIKFLALIIGALLTLILSTLPLSAQTTLTEQSKLAIDGIGPVRVGMTIAEAERSARTRFVSNGRLDNCYHIRPQRGPQGLEFMVKSPHQEGPINREVDRIVRVEVVSGGITTVRGAKIGDTEERIKSLYPGQIRVTTHEYTGHKGGHYLTFIPKDERDRNYRLVFETLNNRVTIFRSGRLPEVEYVEGCA